MLTEIKSLLSYNIHCYYINTNSSIVISSPKSIHVNTIECENKVFETSLKWMEFPVAHI